MKSKRKPLKPVIYNDPINILEYIRRDIDYMLCNLKLYKTKYHTDFSILEYWAKDIDKHAKRAIRVIKEKQKPENYDPPIKMLWPSKTIKVRLIHKGRSKPISGFDGCCEY